MRRFRNRFVSFFCSSFVVSDLFLIISLSYYLTDTCSHYPLLKRNEEIISFFDNFEDYLHEESLWQISESIKARGGGNKK